MDAVQLQSLLSEYKDGISLIVYKTPSRLEAWARTETPEGPAFSAARLEGLPDSYDYRELMLLLSRSPLSVDGERLFVQTRERETILLQNETNARVQKMALTLWPERKVLVAVGCHRGQVGYLEALDVLKQEHIIRVA